MFFLFGGGSSETVLNVVSFVCKYCGVNAPQEVVKSAFRLSVFFIPLFSLGSRYSVTCSNCGGTTELTRNQAQNSLDWAARNLPA